MDNPRKRIHSEGNHNNKLMRKQNVDTLKFRDAENPKIGTIIAV